MPMLRVSFGAVELMSKSVLYIWLTLATNDAYVHGAARKRTDCPNGFGTGVPHRDTEITVTGNSRLEFCSE